MIPKAELHRAAEREGLRYDQAEKDYVILWILRGLARAKFSPEGWTFKGGTCLRHCYYEHYRFSEDLDFSCKPHKGGSKEAVELVHTVSDWISQTSGIRLRTKEPRTVPTDMQVEIPVEYSLGGRRVKSLPSIKIQLTFDEPILTPAKIRPVTPHYSDLPKFKLSAYSKKEILSEKMRALLQQQAKWPRPRDLYDLWFILCHSKESYPAKEIWNLFLQKCRSKKIKPDGKGLISQNLKKINQNIWKTRLGDFVKDLPEFEDMWKEWTKVFDKMFAKYC